MFIKKLLFLNREKCNFWTEKKPRIFGNFKLFSGAKFDIFLPFLKIQIMLFCTFEIAFFFLIKIRALCTLENLLSIRPKGVVSKNAIGERIIRDNIVP